MMGEPPGARSRALSARLAAAEAPGINTLSGGRPSLLWDEARGANVLDVDGNRYLDLTSGFGVAAVGHRHPRVVAAVRAQAARLLHGLGDVHAHPLRVELAERLGALAPVDDPRVFFAVSGAEAVEIAVKTAVAATGRAGVVAFAPSYHGVTLGALAATSRPEFRRPFLAHLHPHVVRLPFGGAPAGVDAALAGGGIACVLVEPIVGREGVLLAPPGWLAEVAALCRARGVPLAADEVFTGLGRTGVLWAVEAEGVRPDLLCCGKALGGGLPIAAVVGRRELMAAWETPGEALHTTTFVAHPLACAAALAALDVIAEERLAERAATFGETLLRPRVVGWEKGFPAVGEVRGRGLLWALELASRAAAAALVEGARRRGVLLLAGGPEGRVVQLVPPLSITRRQLSCAMDLLEAALAGLP
ncbi:MAG TPA: aspartate aminotransferase family protein [Thermoanaerobaculia bacterium]|nr:aspartate aminotransferase family protein [Thermoanaerobaculia bacterium]